MGKRRKFFICNLLKQYLENSNIHGFKYLVEPDRHWTERLFWITACGVSCWACGLMVISTIQFATARDVSITMRTDYLNYHAHLPALHFCVEWNDRAKSFSKETGLQKGTMKYMELGLGATKVPTEEELQELTALIQPTPEDLFGVCMWNDLEINCSQLFFPLRSTAGQCLSFNSLHSINSDNSHGREFIMNHRKPEGRLTIIMNKTQYFKGMQGLPQVYLMNHLEYPTNIINKDKKINFKSGKKLSVIDITAIPILNQPEVIDMSMSMRKCRMSIENAGNLILKWYNYDGCLMEQQMQNMYNMFGCISHIFPRVTAMRLCNVTELQAAKKAQDRIKSITASNCLPDCEEIVYDFSLNNYEYKNLPTWALLQIEVNMLPGPSIQYERYATRSLLQVIISVGSVVGLFMGASLLSIIEILYWLLLRTNP